MTLNKIMSDAWTITRNPDGYYHFINHEQRLLTTGFGSESALVRNMDIIRIDGGTIVRMRKRYEEHYQ